LIWGGVLQCVLGADLDTLWTIFNILALKEEIEKLKPEMEKRLKRNRQSVG